MQQDDVFFFKQKTAYEQRISDWSSDVCSSDLPEIWKKKLPMLQEGDILLHPFSPTGFYSSAVKTPFLMELQHRSERQIGFSTEPVDHRTHLLDVGLAGNKEYYVTRADLLHARGWDNKGYTEATTTPDHRPVSVKPGPMKHN